MKWLEVISVRTGGIIEAEKAFNICKQIFQSISAEKLLQFTVFCNATYATDISIHLNWKSNPGQRSILGSELSAALREFGLISHTLWIEQPEVINGAISAPCLSKTA